MGKDDAPYVSPPVRLLSEGEQGRLLDKLRRLETEAMVTPEWDRVADLLSSWRWSVRLGRLVCSDVPAIASELERWSVR